MARSLTEIANSYQLDKGTLPQKKLDWHKKYPDHKTMGYTPIYEQYIDTNTLKLLEIGICDKRFPGKSLEMWKEYLPYAQIYGIDNFWGNDFDITTLQSDRVTVYKADQSDRKQLAEFFKIYGSNFDYIIEDGAHWPSNIMISLASCLQHVKSGGYYFIEDLQSRFNLNTDAFDNLQITSLFQEFISTGYLHRLYITREEHQYLLNNIKAIKMHHCNHHNLLVIQKI